MMRKLFFCAGAFCSAANIQSDLLYLIGALPKWGFWGVPYAEPTALPFLSIAVGLLGFFGSIHMIELTGAGSGDNRTDA
jgi:hypothetical protein